jgi:hypothetical protein
MASLVDTLHDLRQVDEAITGGWLKGHPHRDQHHLIIKFEIVALERGDLERLPDAIAAIDQLKRIAAQQEEQTQ